MPPDNSRREELCDAARRDVLESIYDVFDGDGRDPDRIPRVLDAIEDYWQEHPDLRLGQLLCILASDAGHDDGDPFHLEDSELERLLTQKTEHQEQ
jgi:predicted Zn-dependent protease with MMP-like domain